MLTSTPSKISGVLFLARRRQFVLSAQQNDLVFDAVRGTRQWKQRCFLSLFSTTSSNQPTTTTNSELMPRHDEEDNGANIMIIADERNKNGPMDVVVERHGMDDRVICLNVGGTEFWTLWSTVCANSVLAEHIRRAESNKELTREGAIFIDRDPAQFDIILQHLRNKVEGLSYDTGSHNVTMIRGTRMFQNYVWANERVRPKTYVQLPKESERLRDLYVEATHYRIPELQEALLQQRVWVTFISYLAGTDGNPFDTASKFLKLFRRGLLAVGGIGTLMIGSDLGSFMDLEWFQAQWKAMTTMMTKQNEEDDESSEL